MRFQGSAVCAMRETVPAHRLANQVRIDPDAYDGKAATDCWAAAASTWRLRLPDGALAFKDYRDYQPEYES
jgi:hypothetical protein